VDDEEAVALEAEDDALADAAHGGDASSDELLHRRLDGAEDEGVADLDRLERSAAEVRGVALAIDLDVWVIGQSVIV
jgi:hypothetical protein